MKLKICGLTEKENILQIAELKPDFIGLNFYRNSKRFVGENFEIPEINGEVKKIGVFVNENLDEIQKMKNRYALDFVQLHGNENPDFCKSLSWKNVRLIKAFGVDENFDFNILRDYMAHCDYFLFDTKTETFGGSGKTFDWALLEKYDLNAPFFLSGGIGLENAAEVSRFKHPYFYGVDINSRFETTPGIKDAKKVREFMNAINHAS